MVLRIASLGFLCVVLSTVACGGGKTGTGGSGGSTSQGGSGGTGGTGGTGGEKLPCENEKKDADNHETGVDCGGDKCDKRCGNGQGCTDLTDCLNGLDCLGGICQAKPSCTNVKEDIGETDVDCGGVCVAETPPKRCELGKKCGGQDDCNSNSCQSGICTPASCTDKQVNNNESDTDCGGVQTGAKCARCDTNKKCTAHADCASLNCENLRCAAATCVDVKQNGDESDVDCGGS